MEVKCNFRCEGRVLKLSDDITHNLLTLNHVDYYVYYLASKNEGNKGGHSFVFKLYEAQTYDEDASPVSIIKIDKNPKKYKGRVLGGVRRDRFRQEVEALYICKENGLENVVRIFCDGYLICSNHPQNEADYAFPFYVMECAENDLKGYLEEERNNIDDAGKIELCLQLARGLKDLYKLEIYHRDIKPDNIFKVNGTWKIGDLGLIAMRNKRTLDKDGEFVGPRGWISPEVMNKYLSEKVEGVDFDCIIDHQSDIFQMGKVFWYILQGNAPIGGVNTSDFRFRNDEMYSLIKHMLNHSKKRRPATIDEVIGDLEKIVKKYYK